ncbi:MAG: hypothetical protein JW822_12170 [Spirochaetales bacterium]|nr:hypothetical protein [Spirochaetales bacterium]
MNRKVLILSFLAAAFLTFLGAPFHKGRFYIHGEDSSSGNLEVVLEKLEQAEQLLSGIFNYLPQENFDIIILDGVWEMEAAFGLGPWIGAFYKDFKSYLQPIETLMKREMLERIVFIEYAHYFFDSYTNSTCPAWFNELCSVYFCTLYVDAVIPLRCEHKFVNFQEFSNLGRNMKDRKLLDAFYFYAFHFARFLLAQYKTNPFSDLINAVHEGAALDESVRKTTGKSLQVIFEEEFLPWLASK